MQVRLREQEHEQDQKHQDHEAEETAKEADQLPREVTLVSNWLQLFATLANVARHFSVALTNFVVTVFVALVFVSVLLLSVPVLLGSFQLTLTIRIESASVAKIAFVIHHLALTRLT